MMFSKTGLESICQTFSKTFLENIDKTLSISCDTKDLSSKLVALGLFNNTGCPVIWSASGLVLFIRFFDLIVT